MRITVDDWIRHKRETGETLHVHLNGDDVTTRCRVADDDAGEVELLVLDADGRAQYDPDTDAPKVEVLEGYVEIIPGVAFGEE